MNPKYQKVLSDIEKAEKKKSEIEGQLKELYDKKTELENKRSRNSIHHFPVIFSVFGKP
jgi:chromosome segregation ATPase